MNSLNPKRAATVSILVSLVFAAAMLISSYVMADSSYRETVMFLLIALWWIPFSFIAARGKPGCCTSRSVSDGAEG